MVEVALDVDLVRELGWLAPRTAVVARRRGRTAGVKLVALEVPVCERGGGPAPRRMAVPLCRC